MMSYDVTVVEKVGEVNIEYNFKNYKDFMDWYAKTNKDDVECEQIIEKEIDDRIHITIDNWRDHLQVGDKVVITKCDDGARHTGKELGIPYKITAIEDGDYNGKMPICLANWCWVNLVEGNIIYKV